MRSNLYYTDIKGEIGIKVRKHSENKRSHSGIRKESKHEAYRRASTEEKKAMAKAQKKDKMDRNFEL